MERKGVKGVRKVKVVFLLSKYQYKKFLAGKPTSSILLHGKVTEGLLLKAKSDPSDLFINSPELSVSNLEANLNKYLVVYVQRPS